MGYGPTNGRLPARQMRQQRYGVADQLAYEAQGRADRAALQARLEQGRAVRRKPKKKGEMGANAGTVGGAWLANFKS
jgi:hypothetical protein